MGTSERPATEILRRVVEETPSLTAAAIQLGISRPTLYRWLRDAGIEHFHRPVRVPAREIPDIVA